MLNPHETEIKERYEGKGYFVYPSIDIFNQQKGYPDLWVTPTVLYANKQYRLNTGGRVTNSVLSPDDGFFVECKFTKKIRSRVFSSPQQVLFPKLLRVGYKIIIESKRWGTRDFYFFKR